MANAALEAGTSKYSSQILQRLDFSNKDAPIWIRPVIKVVSSNDNTMMLLYKSTIDACNDAVRQNEIFTRNCLTWMIPTAIEKTSRSVCNGRWMSLFW